MKNLLKFIIFLIGFTFYCNSNADTTLSSITISSATTYNDNIIIPSGVTLTINNQLTINGDLTVQSGGVITHPIVAVSSFNLVVNGTLDINSGGKIDVSAKGISSAGNESYNGASYGGFGSNNSSKGPYGDVYNPVDVGSYNGSTTRAGGGLVRLSATNLINNGSILANGYNYNYGGSGGGINITVSGVLSGAGTYSANGTGDSSYGAGGGRIAIKYSSLSGINIDTLKSKIQAIGAYYGGAGTIYLKNTSDGTDQLIVKDDSYIGRTSLPFSSYDNFIDLSNVNLVSNLTLNHDFISYNGFTLSLSSTLSVNGNVTIQSGSIITHPIVAVSSFNLVVNGTLDINSGGKIDVSAKGISSAGNESYNGASYGGFGSNNSSKGPYGDVYNPVDVGSYNGSTTRAGGGLVRLSATNLINNGSILANGYNYNYGGSGGGINITVSGVLSGAGTYSANGTGDSSYGAGGGRIAIKYSSLSGINIDTLKSKIQAIGAYYGGAGTIYLKNTSDGTDQLIVKDDSYIGRTSLPFSSYDNFIDLSNVNLVSNLTLNHDFISYNGFTLSLSSTLSVNGNVTIQSGSIITHPIVAVSSFNLVVNGTLDINSGGKIDVSAKGISSAGNESYNGASYGGFGSNNSSKGPYGDVYNPVDVGSYNGSTTRAGGGLVRLSATNLINNGSILANGYNYNYGGSGGGINITVSGVLSGAGTYSANGTGDSSYGAGGGRIAIKYSSLSGINIDTLKSKIQAIGAYYGGAGTIYLKNTSDGTDQLIVKDDSYIGRTSLPFSSYDNFIDLSNVNLVSNLTLNHDFISYNGFTLSLSSTLSVNGNVTIQSGSIITHPIVAVSSFNLVVNGTLDINSGGKIDVSAKGISSAGNESYNGASYGGFGSNNSSKGPYGDVYNPVDVGSYNGSTTRAGGGLVRLSATNLINNGSILANGYNYNYGGSGGGINITVSGVLSGAGTYSANGTGDSSYGAGGGRIAIKYSSLSGINIDTLKSKIQAIGAYYGGAGTIYLKNTSDGTDQLIVKDDSYIGRTSLPFSSYDNFIDLSNVNLVSNLTLNHDFISYNGFTLSLSSTLSVNGNVTIQSGSIITHPIVAVSSFNLVVNGTLDINSGGKIDVSAKGISSAGNESYNGASYGGFGSNNSSKGPYGDVYNPVDVGSYNGSTTRAGGGLVRLSATNLINNGSILANGYNYNYGGSGGGINITVSGVLSGAGTYSANGTGDSSYGAGGGRIAIKYSSLSGINIDTLKSKIQAIGAYYGGAGTIYLKNTSDGTDQLIVKDEGTSGGKYTGVGTGYTDYLFNTIEVGTGAKLYKLGTENIYGKTCITNGAPTGVIDTNISCNGNPGFIYYDIGATIKGLSSISRNYEFVILDQPSNGGIFLTASSGSINGNGTAASKLKISKIGNYKILFNLYNGTASGSEIYKSLQKNISVTK